MLKVFLVVRWPVGGIRTFIKYVYSNWPGAPLELHILTPNLTEVNVLRSQLQNVKCVWYATDDKDPSFKAFSIKANSIINANSFDLIHAHGFTSALSVSWRLIFSRVKSIFTSHDVINKDQFNGLFGKIKKVLMPMLLNRFTVIHSVSHDAQLNLHEQLPLINHNKSIVILNGVDTTRFFNAPKIDIKSHINIPEEVILIGFFGRFMSQKGFKYLVDAMAELNIIAPNRYKVVCFGAGGFIREEKISLERRSLSHLFHFHDFVADTAPYVKGCDLVVMPSLWEACGLVAMEVLSAGVPLVASNCIGLSEVCKETPAIMVAAKDSTELLQGILRASDNQKLIFSAFAPDAREKFDVNKRILEIKSLYHDLLGVQ